MEYSNSSLVTYTDLSPKCNPRSDAPKYGCIEKIDRITIHHMAGSYGVKECGRLFHVKDGSSNYGLDDFDTALYVPESSRSWCSANRYNDFAGITIECCNTEEGVKNKTWEISDATYNRLIELCVDICQRNGKTKVVEISDEVSGKNISQSTTIANNYSVPSGTMLLTQHCYFASTACPGPYIKSKWKNICADINAKLGGCVPDPEPVPTVIVAQPIIKKGSKGANAQALQRNLNALGFTDDKGRTLDDDGIIGNCSIQALKKFQKSNGLVADGIYGNLSYIAMQKYF